MQALVSESNVFSLLARGNMRLLLGGILASGVNAASTITLVILVKSMMEDGGTPTAETGLYLLGLFALTLTSYVVSGACMSGLGVVEMAKMRRRLADAIIATEFERIERIGLNRLHAAFTEDLPRIALAYIGMPVVMLNSLITICALGYLAFVSLSHFALLAALLVSAVIVSEMLLRRKIRHFGERLRKTMDELYAHIEALVYGNKELKLNTGRAAFFRERLFERDVRRIGRLSRKQLTYTAAFNGWSTTVTLILLAGILWVSHVWLPMAQADMIAFALVLMYLRGPIIAIVNNVPNLTAAGVALRNVRGLELQASRTAVPAITHRRRFWRTLELRDVEFDYAPDGTAPEFRLAPVSLTIHEGEVVYVTGGNGSGKSTFAKLLTGLYTPTRGSIELDGVEVTPRRLDAYRARFSAVFGDYFLFREVLDGDGEPLNDDAAHALLRRTDMESRVTTSDGAFSTLALSQGQRKRLALIVALAEDKPILLFDEWAAEQDPVFRRRFYCEIVPALKTAGKTVIAITHDEQYFHTADRVLRMDQGELSEVETSRVGLLVPEIHVAAS